MIYNIYYVEGLRCKGITLIFMGIDYLPQPNDGGFKFFEPPAFPAQFEPDSVFLGEKKADIEADLIRGEETAERAPPEILPPMPEEIPPEAEDVQELQALGEQILEAFVSSPSFQALIPERVLDERVEDPAAEWIEKIPEGMDRLAGIFDAPGFSATLTSSDVVAFGASTIEFAFSLAVIGRNMMQVLENKKIIAKAQEQLTAKQPELDRLKSELQALPDENKAARTAELQGKIDLLETEVAFLNEAIQNNGEKIKDLYQNMGQVALRSTLRTTSSGAAFGGEICTTATAHTTAASSVHAALFAGSVAGALATIAVIAITSKELNENRLIANKINQEIATVRQELEIAKSQGDNVMEEFLNLRLRNLDVQLSENKVNAVKNALYLSAGVLGSVAAAKSIAVLVGVTIGAAFGTAATVTGIAVPVAVAGALTIGGGYLIYKNRHAIENSLQNASISMQERGKERTILSIQQEKSGLTGKLQEAEARVKSTRSIEQPGEGGVLSIKEQAEDLLRNEIEALYGAIQHNQEKIQKHEEAIARNNQKIDELKEVADRIPTMTYAKQDIFDKIRGLRVQNVGPVIECKHLRQQNEKMEREIRGKIEELQNRAIARGERQRMQILAREDTHRRIRPQIEQTDEKIMRQVDRLLELQERREAIAVRYYYGKDVAKFGKSETGQAMSEQELKGIHDRLYEAASKGPDQMKKIRDYISKQNARLESNSVDVRHLMPGVTKDNFWKVVIEGAAALAR